MNIQWYPGHMTKALRQMKEDLKLIDLVIEIVDSRIPLSSRNPDIDELAKGKARMIILNKADLADQRSTDEWCRYFSENGIAAIPLDSRSKKGMGSIRDKCRESCREKTERDLKRGIKARPIRAMIVGIPNVGKSTFINSFSGKASAKTGNKPGVTKGEQWIRVDKQLELLDTPGILWPKFEDQTVGLHLAAIGSINDEIVSRDDICSFIMDFCGNSYGNLLEERYGGTDMNAVAARLGCLTKGGEPDMVRASKLLIDDFRSGKLGRITIERVGQTIHEC